MKYKIPVYWRSWSTRYYLTHPWKIVKDWINAGKNLWARARKGYAWVDLWNLDGYLGTMIPNALDELADRSCGSPCNDEWPTYEDWTAELHVLAHLLRICNYDSVDEDDKLWEGLNEWRGRTCLQPIQHLQFYNEYVLSDDEIARIDAIKNDYWRAHVATEILRQKAFTRLAHIYPTLWD